MYKRINLPLITIITKRALPEMALVSLICCISVQCLLVSACMNRRELAQYLTEQGRKRMEDGDNKGAISNFSSAIMADPNYAPAYYHRAEAEYRTKDYAGAAGDFGTAAALYDATEDKARAYYKEAKAQRMRGRRKEALESAENAVKAGPRCVLCYYWRGRIRADSGQYGAAIEDFGRCLKLERTLSNALLKRAETFMGLGKYRETMRDLDKYAQSVKDPVQSFLIIKGYARWGLGNIDVAKELFEKVLEKSGDDPKPLVALGKIELAAHNIKAARERFNKAIWTGKRSPEAYLARCVAEFLEGDYSTAYDDCVRARLDYGVFPGAGRAMFFSWVVQLRRGQTKWARGAVSDFINAANPVEWRMPILKFAAGKINEKELLHEVKKINAGGNKRLCETYFMLAQVKFEDDRVAAVSYLKKASRICPPYSLERLAADYQLK